MTLEEMQELARKVVEALKKSGFADAEYLEEDQIPGHPLLIVFSSDGDTFGLDLSPL